MRADKMIKIWIYLFVPVGILLVIRQIFHILFLGPPITAIPYLYLLMALFLPGIFLTRRINEGISKEQLPWYDLLSAILSSAIPFYFVCFGDTIILRGWEVKAPPHAILAALILIPLLIEGARRIGGTSLAIIVLIFTFYPLIADKMPGPLWGASTSFGTLFSRHAFSTDSILGVPMRAVGQLIIGFLIFSCALIELGGGKFLVDICLALLGTIRGGPAKVEVISSGLCGITIPMMMRTGYKPHEAAAIEACSSTGGPIMPPIMGSVAFLMAEFLQVPYAQIVIAAFPPAFLYFFALLLGVDALAVKANMKGLPRKELPKVKDTFLEGWIYLVPIVALIYLLLVEELETQAPFYATGTMFIFLLVLRKIKWSDFEKFLLSTGDIIAEMVTLLGAVGLIIGSLSMTGVSVSATQELVDLAGNNVYLILLFGFVAAFILGMGMSMAGVYVVLAVTLAPALMKVGLDPFASHLFVIYGAVISYITPPVAIGAFVAAGIAKADPIKTGFQAMRIALVIYIIPFLFALNSGLILRDAIGPSILSISFVSVGMFPMVGAIEGYIVGIGRLNIPMRVVAGISAVFLFLPARYLGISFWINLAGIIPLICMFPLRSVSVFRWEGRNPERLFIV
jgi:TRAP transporter 4TM/12TM fusion protein